MLCYHVMYRSWSATNCYLLYSRKNVTYIKYNKSNVWEHAHVCSHVRSLFNFFDMANVVSPFFCISISSLLYLSSSTNQLYSGQKPTKCSFSLWILATVEKRVSLSILPNGRACVDDITVDFARNLLISKLKLVAVTTRFDHDYLLFIVICLSNYLPIKFVYQILSIVRNNIESWRQLKIFLRI